MQINSRSEMPLNIMRINSAWITVGRARTWTSWVDTVVGDDFNTFASEFKGDKVQMKTNYTYMP